MSDVMRPIPYPQLLDWVLTEYRNEGSIFGVSKIIRHTDGVFSVRRRRRPSGRRPDPTPSWRRIS